MPSRHLVLVGFMASGKSTLGARVAELLGRPFVDVDDSIEAMAGTTIEAVFAQQGETRFREFESAALQHALGGPPAVIATGGGAPEDDDNWRLMLDGNVVVHLSADPAELLRRIGSGDGRPLASATSQEAMNERLLSILERRQARYAEAPHTVTTSGRDIETTASELAGIARDAGLGQLAAEEGAGG
jgi:shikimate kinase